MHILSFFLSFFLCEGKMESTFPLGYCILICMGFLMVHGDPIVPMICIFGDSVVDVGNNNYLNTMIKSNFPPYGRDFVDHKPTGRFCDGKLATDFTAEYMGFNSYPPPYLSQEAQGQRLLTGVNFASGGCGYYDRTSQFYGAISLPRQLAYYMDYQDRVKRMVGVDKANDIFSRGIHLLSAGSSDFLQNYYINPLIYRYYSPDQFSDVLMQSYSIFIQSLYNLGARRIGVTGPPPTGCLPAAITMFGAGSNQCVARLNQDAVSFNSKLNNTSKALLNKLRGLRLVVFDIYQPLVDLISKPNENGFFESRRASCGTGTVETSILCNERSIGTCSNATGYVFWDGFHPSENANKVLADNLLMQGFSLIA